MLYGVKKALSQHKPHHTKCKLIKSVVLIPVLYQRGDSYTSAGDKCLCSLREPSVGGCGGRRCFRYVLLWAMFYARSVSATIFIQTSIMRVKKSKFLLDRTRVKTIVCGIQRVFLSSVYSKIGGISSNIHSNRLGTFPFLKSVKKTHKMLQYK